MARNQTNGLRGRVVQAMRGDKRKSLAQRAASDITDAAADVRRRLTGGETKRGIAGRKAAATRKRNAAKRSAAAKQGARTRAATKR
jgi:hypothetical protein